MEPSPRLILLLAAASGAAVANIYYAQPLIGLIAPAIGLPIRDAGLLVTVTQLGYMAGMLGVASLADLFENRRLTVACLAVAALALAACAAAPTAAIFLAASFAVGVSSVATQVLVPLAAHLAPERVRGRTVGNVMAGLLAGIMLARPVSSLLASVGGWRLPFAVAALAMAGLALLLRRALPERRPFPRPRYGEILRSMAVLLRREPILRRRALYQALMFAGFNVFWTAVPLPLAREWGFGQFGIACFALAGAAGALVAPVAGRLADRGLTERVSAGAMALLTVGFACAAGGAWHGGAGGLVALALGAIAIDTAVQANQICGQRVIYGLAPALRGRLNALYVACVFAAGAAGSFVGTVAFALGGFRLTGAVGVAIGLACLAAFRALGGSVPRTADASAAVVSG